MNSSLDIEDLKSKCDQLVAFIREKGGGSIMNEFSKAILLAYSKQDHKGLKTAVKDLSEWAKDFGPEGENVVHQILEETENDVKKEMQKIVAKGCIENDDEYRILLGYVDEHFSEPENYSLIETINVLLSNYSKKT